MSPVEQAIRNALADPAVDFMSLGRTRQGDFFASVKRCYGRGYGVFYDPDPCTALVKALTAPDASGAMDAAFRDAKAAALAAGRIAPPEPTVPAVDDDLFG